jgi:nucleotide-binding universal stress UspA family protein
VKILVPTDGSVCALRALDYAINLDKLMGNSASISLLSVHDDTGLKHVRKHFPKGTIEDYLHDLSVKELKLSRTKLDKASLDHEVIIKTGHVAGEIIKVAKSGKFDLIVMGVMTQRFGRVLDFV